MVNRVNLKKEADDFDSIYRERALNTKSILVDGKRVEKYYFKNAWRYDFSRQHFFGSILEDFNKILPLKKNLCILDIGCGNGWFSLNANLRNENFWDCIDISPEAILTAREYNSKLQLRNNYYVCSMEDFKSDTKYDVITCVNTLHHITDLKMFRNSIKTHLKPDGKVFIHDVSADLFSKDSAVFVLLIKIILNFTKGIKYFEKFKEKDMKRRLEDIICEWRNETDAGKQSHHDHFHSSKNILNFLKKNFDLVSLNQYGGVLLRLMGGLRGDKKLMKELAKELIEFEKMLLESNFISPYTYTFVGKK